MGIDFRPILLYPLSHNIAVLQRDDDVNDDVNDDDEKSIDSIVSRLEKTSTV